MLTKADMVRIMAENYGVAHHGTGNPLAEQTIDDEMYDGYDDSEQHEISYYEISRIDHNED